MVIKQTHNLSPSKNIQELSEAGPSDPNKCSSSRRLLAVTATRLPYLVLAHIFSHLSLRELRACMTVCRHWYNVLEVEDNSVWAALAKRYLPEAAITDPYLLTEVPTFKQKLRAYMFAWNPRDTSKNNYLVENLFTMHRQPVAQSTDAIRGKIGVNSGVHAWDMVWEGPLGTVAVAGVATKHAALHCPGYVALLGSDDQSWGWNLVDNTLLHNAELLGIYPRMNNPPRYQVGERIRMIIDCEAHAIYFERPGTSEFLGIAFVRLPPVRLYPAVCAVYGNTEVSLVYVGPAIMG